MSKYPAYATKVLLDSIIGHKIICKDQTREFSLPNISAVILNDDSRKYIGNSFSALSMPWFLHPTNEGLVIYRNSIRKNYDRDNLEYFDLAWKSMLIHKN